MELDLASFIWVGREMMTACTLLASIVYARFLELYCRAKKYH